MSRKATILFVDDEERILKSLRITFKSQYQVKTTTDGYEAIDIVRNEPVHVIVSDQRMPIMPGVEVLRGVREVSPNTMRLLLTGYSDLAAIVGSVNEGEIFRYINKPWDNEDIQKTVATAAEIALRLESLPYKEAESKKSVTANLGILVIDNDVSTFELVADIIGESNPIKWSNNLEEAFKILSENRSIAVIISEVRVGAENISQALKILKQYHPNTLALVVTSFRDTHTLIDLINQGQIYRFLPKPIAKGQLERGIRDALWRYSFLKKVPQALDRYQVEKPKQNTLTVSNKLLGYLKRLRAS